MKKHLITAMLAAVLASAFAVAQTTGEDQAGISTSRPAQAGQQVPGTTAGNPNPSTQASTPAPGTEQNSQDVKQSEAGSKSAQPGRSASSVPDAGLRREVQQQFASNPDFSNVQITVENGVVSLNGTVPNQSDRKQAKQFAAAVPGVRKVYEHLKVSAIPATGNTSTAPAQAGNAAAGEASEQNEAPAAGSAGAASSSETQAASQPSGSQAGVAAGSSATSGGTADTTASQAPEESSAGAAAPGAAAQSQVAGTMPGAGTTSPSAGCGSGATASTDLQTQLQGALKNDPTLANDSINVNVSNDAITLSGTVQTGAEKQTAKRMAQSFAGSCKVIDNLTVRGMGQGANTGENPPENPR